MSQSGPQGPSGAQGISGPQGSSTELGPTFYVCGNIAAIDGLIQRSIVYDTIPFDELLHVPAVNLTIVPVNAPVTGLHMQFDYSITDAFYFGHGDI